MRVLINNALTNKTKEKHKLMKKTQIKAIAIIIAFLAFSEIKAGDNMFMEAMKEEVARGMEGLILDRMLPPSYISYHISDAEVLHVKASLGGIIKSQSQPMRKFNNRILVTSDGVTNENYIDRENLFGVRFFDDNLPLTGSKDDIRRALWLVTDQNYKAVLSTHESKLSAMRQQSLSQEELELPDFLPADAVKTTIAHNRMNINKKAVEQIARNLSAVFSDHSSIQSSEVNIYVYDGQIFYHNSEGAEAQYPFQAVAIMVVASAQNEKGEILQDHYLHFANKLADLPSELDLLEETRAVANHLELLTKVEPFSEPYTGPVLFEGQAAAEAFAQVFFGSIDGLISVRKPIVGDEQILRFAADRVRENSLEARMGRRIISRDISIKALPRLESYNNTRLIGSFFVDGEGQPSVESLTLVEDGMLQNLLSSRTPSLHVQESNAHARLALSRGSVQRVVAPGVIKMTVDEDEAVSMEEIRELLLREAEDEGLEYAYIVRKAVSPAARFGSAQGAMMVMGASQQGSSDFSKTIEVYRIYVEDGREEPVSLAEIKGLSMRSFRRMLGATSDMQVYNTMFTPGNARLFTWRFELTGTPVSYILPQAILFEELDITSESQRMIRRPPVVSNPLE